jgi:hypothetical protein
VQEQRGKHKVVLIGDSHIRGLSSELKQNVDKTYETVGFTKPNACVSVLVDTVKEEVDKLMGDDVIVFWRGANNVSKYYSTKGLYQTIDFVRRNQQTNIIIITVPHRFDLEDSSCIKKEIKAYNRRLNKVANHFNRVTLVNAASERNLFTSHELHMNVRGKEAMCTKLAVIIHEIVDECNKSYTIPMNLKDD